MELIARSDVEHLVPVTLHSDDSTGAIVYTVKYKREHVSTKYLETALKQYQIYIGKQLKDKLF